MSKKKHRKKLHFSQFQPNSTVAVQPLDVAASKDSHGPSNTPPARQQPPVRSDVKVFIGDPPAFLFSIPEWEALDRIGMRDRTFGWTCEMQVKAVRARMRIAEVPVSYRRRIGVSKITGTVSGTLRAGYKILLTIFRYG